MLYDAWNFNNSGMIDITTKLYNKEYSVKINFLPFYGNCIHFSVKKLYIYIYIKGENIVFRPL